VGCDGEASVSVGLSERMGTYEIPGHWHMGGAAIHAVRGTSETELGHGDGRGPFGWRRD
jgi:anti-sigma factor ChrR (cupin superfamily)